MTREPIPPFDLYAELEVPRSASVARIEAAYRALAKVHHPDVARTSGAAVGARPASAAGDERIKRLNLARDWLTDPDRRRRYDASTGGGTKGLDGVTRAGPPDWSAPDRAHFGTNAAEVRQYLADLRAIDESRADELRPGLEVADAAGRLAARRSAFAVSRATRLTDWLYAREAASIIVRTRLPGAANGATIAEALADVAGAIAIRDLLSPSNFELLLLPWTWRGERVLPQPAPTTSAARRAGPEGARTNPPAASPPSAGAWSRRHVGALAGLSASLVALVGLLALTTVGGAFQPRTASNLAGASFNQVVSGIEQTSPPAGPTSTPAEPSTGPVASPPGGIDPALLAQLQQGAAGTIERLKGYARVGDLFDARRLLAGAAHLTVAGFMRATFPSVEPADITVERSSNGTDGAGWVATAGTDTLTSTDGSEWTFQYGERPLAVYGRSSEHTLFFIEGDGQHDVFVTVTSVVVSPSSVRAVLNWRFAGSSDAVALHGDWLTIGALTFGTRSYDVVAAPIARLSGGSLTRAIVIPIRSIPAASGTITVRLVDGADPARFVDTTIKLREL